MSAINLIIVGPGGSGTRWLRSITGNGIVGPLRRGWNYFRISAATGTLTDWGQFRRFDVQIVATGPAKIAVSHLWMECPPRARMIFVEDRGYRSFINNGLPALRSRSIPVTWALDMALNSPDTSGPHITNAEVEQFAAAGDVMSIHAYDGAATANMTPDQIRVDALRAIAWLDARGLGSGALFRAAYTQNLATNASAAEPFFAAQASSTNLSASMETWPHVNPQNVGRYTLHGRSNADLDARFDTMKKTHCLWIPYTHGVATGGAFDMTQAGWDYFLAKYDQAVAEGWMEATTWPRLLATSGGIVR
ncbi:MAG: hypothetical protein ACK4M5_00350 [Dietzia cercidiphylli]